MPKHVAIYLRVSTTRQKFDTQTADLERWSTAQDEEVRWYRDKVSGKTRPSNRPGWSKLNAAIHKGKVSKVVIWRLDRLGRKAASLLALFDDLQERTVDLISIKDAITLNTASGRVVAHILAAMAEFERELNSERVEKARETAEANGRKFGGSKPGVAKTITPEQQKLIVQLYEEGMPKQAIARTLQISRPSVQRWLDWAAAPIGGE